ncbi:hypothetical protein ATCC90586_002608 [Pythium insidiosum]|nr:hypothetical protein ATCC90586_002608 [Pythium insidiosum]
MLEVDDNDGHGHPRYSIKKFVAMDDYCQSTPLWRVLLVIAFTPLPGTLLTLCICGVPLRDPTRGVMHTPGIFLHLFLFVIGVTFGTLLHTLAGVDVPTSVYSTTEALVMSCVCSAIVVVTAFPFAVYFLFPIPFTIATVYPIWFAIFCVTHVMVFRKRLHGPRGLISALRLYVPALFIQQVQVVIYPFVSVIYAQGGFKVQIVLTLLFPVLKLALKRALARSARPLNRDNHADVIVSGIEIPASIYQSMVMQSAPTAAALGAIMGIDVIQGIFAVKLFMDKKVPTSRGELFAKAIGTIRAHSIKDWASIASSRGDNMKRRSSIEWLSEESADRVAVVRRALELSYVAESILLVEYFEVAIPIANMLYLLVAAQLPSAVYNLKVRPFYNDDDALRKATSSVLLYTLLQGISLVAMQLVMSYRYNLRALHQVAFALEYHMRSVQGKIIGWLVVILHLTLVHYGTDFSLQFNYAELLNNTTTEH